jgi:DNA-binding PadR family transcriptional regulator
MDRERRGIDNIIYAVYIYNVYIREWVMIGKFEELTLLALMKAGPDAHAAKVYAAMEEKLKVLPKFAALYITLDRMTKKKLVKERQSSASEGRPKRLFTISGEGRRALDESVNASRSLLEGIPGLPGMGRRHG